MTRYLVVILAATLLGGCIVLPWGYGHRGGGHGGGHGHHYGDSHHYGDDRGGGSHHRGRR